MTASTRTVTRVGSRTRSAARRSSASSVLRRAHGDATWRIVGLGVATALLLVSDHIGLPSTAALWATWLVVLLVRGRSRIAAVFFVCISAYGTVAWLAAQYGNHFFPPFPTLAVIESVTLTDLRAVIAAYLAVELVVGLGRLSDVVRSVGTRSRERLLRLADVPTARLVVLLPLLVVGLVDWVGVVRLGIGAVLGGSRREFANNLLLTTDHNVQVVIVTLSIIAAVWAVWADRKIPVVLALVLCWTPFALVGSRKELLLVAAAVGLMVATSGARKVLAVFGGLVVLMFLQPVLKTGDIYDSLHEFILPQYMHFSLAMNYVSPDFAGPFLERAQYLLPGPLRITEPVNMALAFFQTGTADVGVGSSPFAEAQIIDTAVPVELSFALLILGLVLFLIATSRALPFVALVAYSQLLTFGRSDTWIAMFFVVYIGLLLHVVERLFHGQTARISTTPSTGNGPDDTRDEDSHAAHVPLGDEHDRPIRRTRTVPHLARRAGRVGLRDARRAVRVPIV